MCAGMHKLNEGLQVIGINFVKLFLHVFINLQTEKKKKDNMVLLSHFDSQISK